MYILKRLIISLVYVKALGIKLQVILVAEVSCEFPKHNYLRSSPIYISTFFSGMTLLCKI